MPTIFLDNDAEHIDNWQRHFPNSRTIKIDDTTPNPLGNGNTYYDGYIHNYNIIPREVIRLRGLPSTTPFNTYTELLQRNRMQIDSINPSNGITQADITSVLSWVDENPANRIAVFDWDRTLSVFEGAPMPMGPWNSPGINSTPLDALNYMFGGTERVELIKNMFNTLHAKGVNVFIITNSGNATNNRPTILEVIKLICPHFVDEHLIYSGKDSRPRIRTDRNDKGYTDKATALEQNTQYKSIPQELKGGRKRKMRNTRKLRKIRKTKSRGKRRASKTSWR